MIFLPMERLYDIELRFTWFSYFYRQLKNRKSARECRKKRKAERFGMIHELEDLRQKNKALEDEVK